MTEIYAVYGASGFGREVLPVLRGSLDIEGKNNKIVFIDDAVAEKSINGYDVLSFEEYLMIKADEKYVSLAIADGSTRRKLFEKIDSHKLKHKSVFADNMIMMDGCSIGENSILAPFVTITSNIIIGLSFHANIYSYVAHDCVIGDYVTFAPGVKCNGNVEIGDNVYIGTGAIIKQGKPSRTLKIGSNVTIAAGSVVTKNVPEGITVFGNPAVPLTRENMRKMR
jgi:sugar O-acyltransferase (sialic acid O-acetyltransferase NeuD family)